MTVVPMFEKAIAYQAGCHLSLHERVEAEARRSAGKTSGTPTRMRSVAVGSGAVALPEEAIAWLALSVSWPQR
ncbi:hypothetical protein RBB79_14070 [Tunturiibacter empetritectus]|uniref:Uncharacterized protein n=2 Tax=Tunturiibacter TaxID=3154218 RepID=A0A852VCX8_9BACT|nr:hypothetical protein [Edaphobacter lichenicola]NYF90738.1 hypothetical protein [Edaphobacter lichenicola]